MPALRYALPPATIEDVARAAVCSARTVRRYLAGRPLSESSVRRIEAALRARKLHAHLRAAAAASVAA